VAEEAEPDRRRRLIQSAREHEVGDGCVDDPGRMVVRDGEGSATAGDDRLQDIRRLDARIVHASVAEEDQLERTGRAIGDDHEEALAVAMQELRPDDVGDRLVVDQTRPGRRGTGTPPDLDDRDQAPRGRGTDAGEGLEAREVHRREPREAARATEDRAGQGTDALAALTRAEHEREHFVVGE